MPLRLFRPLFVLAAFGAVAAASVAAEAGPAAAGLNIIHAYSGWRDAASFKRISEYFDGRENTGGEIILRTHPDQRGGYYFLVRVANPGPPLAARIVLDVVTPDSATSRTFAFSTSLPANKDAVLDLGLTGADWADRTIHAVAWRLELVDDAGRSLATTKSYLWDKPSGG